MAGVEGAVCRVCGTLGFAISDKQADTIPPGLVLTAAGSAAAGLLAGLLASAGSTLRPLRLRTVAHLCTG